MNSTAPDQPAGPDPEDFEITDAGEVVESKLAETPEEAAASVADQPGAPTADELAADSNLFPQGTPDEVLDGTQVADFDNMAAVAPEESGDHAPDDE